MVAAVRDGRSQRAVARQFGVSRSTVQLWLARAGDHPLDAVDWMERPPLALHVRRSPVELEDLILELRRTLRAESVLGEYGPQAIERELRTRSDLDWPVPSVRTIARILERRGALDARHRIRRPAPPAGWYLSEVRSRRIELDSFDVIEGLRLKGGQHLSILTGISLHGGLPSAWPTDRLTAALTARLLEEHWRSVGLPGYAQFDNDMRFTGGHVQPESVGLVIRLCLALGIVPVFAPVREMGFQASIEAFNGRWQRQLWTRFWDPTLADLIARSASYIAVSRQRSAVRIEAAPPRAAFPDWHLDLAAPPSGGLVFLRRTGETGQVSILGRTYSVDRGWVHRLVRAELDIDQRRLAFFALRRREPDDQPFLAEVPFNPPARWYRWPGGSGIS